MVLDNENIEMELTHFYQDGDYREIKYVDDMNEMEKGDNFKDIYSISIIVSFMFIFFHNLLYLLQEHYI